MASETPEPGETVGDDDGRSGEDQSRTTGGDAGGTGDVPGDLRRTTLRRGLGGRVIGGYRLIRELGQGGQGYVWEAEDLRLHRHVALKLLPRVVSFSTKERLRFEREAEVTSKLEHPAICTVYEVGEDDGIPFIAMQLIEGEALDRRIKAAQAEAMENTTVSQIFIPFDEDAEPGEFDEEDPAPSAPHLLTPTPTAPSKREEVFAVCRLFESAARALHAAHEAGLIHRDIKPGNIMMTPEGKAVLLDFGLARDELTDGASLTETGDFMGTPAYMSPEQLLAHRIRLDRRTDIYSIGVTIYECLTLKRPFHAPTREALYEAISQKIPEKPRQLNPAIPRDLEVVVETAMERDRDRRYPTALQLADELRRIVTYEPIVARPASPLLRLRRWAQRSPALATALVAALLLLVATTVVASLLYVQNQRIQTALARERAAKAAQETAVTQKDAAVSEMHRATEAESLARARSCFETGRRAAQRGRWHEAMDAFDEALLAGHPDPTAIEIARVEAYLGMAPGVDAKEILLQLKPDEHPAHRAKLLLLHGMLGQDRLAHPDAGLEQIRAALETGELSEAETHLANSFFADSIPAARAALEASLEAEPSYLFTNEFYLNLLVLTLDLERARQFSAIQRAAFPSYDLTVNIISAFVAASEGRVDEAVDILESIELLDSTADRALKFFVASAGLLRKIPELTLFGRYVARHQREDEDLGAELVSLQLQFNKLMGSGLGDSVAATNAGVGIAYNIPPVVVRFVDARFRALGISELISAMFGETVDVLQILQGARKLGNLPFEELETLYRIHPEEPVHTHMSALAHMERKQFDVAIARFRSAADHAPSAWFERLSLTMAVTSASQWALEVSRGGDRSALARVAEISLPPIRRLLTKDDLLPEDYNALIVTVRELGRHEFEAIVAARYQYDYPRNVAACWACASVNERLGRWGRALDAARAVLEIEPDHDRARRVLEAARHHLADIVGEK